MDARWVVVRQSSFGRLALGIHGARVRPAPGQKAALAVGTHNRRTDSGSSNTKDTEALGRRGEGRRAWERSGEAASQAAWLFCSVHVCSEKPGSGVPSHEMTCITSRNACRRFAEF